MKKRELNNRIHYYLTCLLAFFIPLHPKILPVLIVLLTVNWVWMLSDITRTAFVISRNYALLTMIIFYLLNVAGLIHTSNFRFANEELETKLSFLILPIVFAGYSDESRKKIFHYLKLFSLGCLVYAVICFGYSLYAYFKPVYTNIEGNLYNFGSNYFYYTYLSLVFHPSYAAIYSCVGIFFIYYLSRQRSIRLSAGWITSIAILCFFVLLLSSKAGWISLLFVFIVIGYDLIKNALYIRFFISLVLLVSAFLTFNIFKAPEFAQRIPQMESIEYSLHGKDKNDQSVNTGADGTARRIFVWKASWEVFKEHFITGVGTGDSKNKLLEKYQELNMKSELANKLNSHNQFFTYMIAFGISGLIVFILCFYFPLRIAWKLKDPLLVVLIGVIAINCLFESIFERQDGVIVYAFLQSLICSAYFPKMQSEEVQKFAD
jgi:O-antigen ligase